MSNTATVLKDAQVSALIVNTAGASVEPKRALLRRATPVEQNAYGSQTQYMIDRCPGCGEAIPAVPSKLQKTLIIATHGKFAPQGEIVCSYGGEPLDLQGNDLP